MAGLNESGALGGPLKNDGERAGNEKGKWKMMSRGPGSVGKEEMRARAGKVRTGEGEAEEKPRSHEGQQASLLDTQPSHQWTRFTLIYSVLSLNLNSGLLRSFYGITPLLNRVRSPFPLMWMHHYFYKITYSSAWLMEFTGSNPQWVAGPVNGPKSRVLLWAWSYRQTAKQS